MSSETFHAKQATLSQYFLMSNLNNCLKVRNQFIVKIYHINPNSFIEIFHENLLFLQMCYTDINEVSLSNRLK
jgi:hypothetical protein